MRKEICKLLRSLFSDSISAELPYFDVLKGEVVPSGCVLFGWKMSEATKAFILLQPHRYEDAFFVEVAVSSDEKWPAYTIPVLPGSIGQFPPIRVRLSRFWKQTGLDIGWGLEPELETERLKFDREPLALSYALLRLPEAVEKSVEALKKWGIPFFDQFRNMRQP